MIPLRIVSVFVVICGVLLAACQDRLSSNEADLSGQIGTDELITRSASLAAACSGCHASAGLAIVSLDRYSAASIAGALRAYKADDAGQTVMHRLARGYTEADIEAVATYLARQKSVSIQ